MKKKPPKPNPPKFVPNREYKPDMAMRQAAQRAQYQPKMLTITSKVKDKA